jgi:hypothetical protein
MYLTTVPIGSSILCSLHDVRVVTEEHFKHGPNSTPYLCVRPKQTTPQTEVFKMLILKVFEEEYEGNCLNIDR